jgi:hypothetical protein
MPNTSWASEDSVVISELSIQLAEQHSELVESIDYDIHGVVGVRLINCPPKDAAAVARKFGLLQRRLERTPDIIVRFVKQMETPGLTHLGIRRYAYTDQDFFLVAEKNGAKTKINFEQIGGRVCEIVCESGTQIVSLLTTLINLTALKKNYVSLHASAFSYKGVGVLVSGWKKGGKTESVLAFARHGIRYIGDEWILLSGDGCKMHGIPGLVPLWDWHFKYLPRLRRQVPMASRMMFRTVRGLDRLQRVLPKGKLGELLPIRFLRDALPPLKKRLNVTFEPEAIFSSPLGWLSASSDKIVLAMSHANKNIVMEPADPKDVAARMAASVQFEQLGFFEHYLAFRFAFPERSSEFMENLAERQEAILRRALEGKETYELSHPYPCSLHDLASAMTPVLTPNRLPKAA